METVLKEKFFLQIDFAELREQKQYLLTLCEVLGDKRREQVEGVIGILDSIQDQAVDKFGLNSELVFGPGVE